MANGNLEELTVDELRDRAKHQGITSVSHMRKSELIEALTSGDGAKVGGETTAKPKARTIRGESGGPDAVQLLTEDHRRVEKLFEGALELDPGDASIAEQVEAIVRELELHTQVEETIFYPALKDQAQSENEDDAKEDVLEAYVEHGSVKDLIAKLGTTDPSDESYHAMVKVMSELVGHHVEEEEGEMFKVARKLLGNDRLSELGGQIADAKERGGATA